MMLQTIRDYVTASSAFGGAALLFVSILVGLSRTGFFVEPCVGGPACKPAAMLGFIKFASVIINFILVSGRRLPIAALLSLCLRAAISGAVCCVWSGVLQLPAGPQILPQRQVSAKQPADDVYLATVR